MSEAWVWRMAWRESRGSRRRLVVFLSSMVVGVALLVALTSTADSLRRTVDNEARTILGADARFQSSFSHDGPWSTFVDSLDGVKARRTSLMSMAYFPEVEYTRLVSVKAVERGYPLYGSIRTDPPEAAAQYHDHREALVDRGLMDLLGLVPGDTVRIGRHHFAIGGSIERAPGETEVTMLVMPAIYLPLDELDPLLTASGAFADREVFVRFPHGTDVEALREELRPRLDALEVSMYTVDDSQDQWREALQFFTRFLALAGFAALVLGGLGVGGAIGAHVRRCLDNVAVLRCLGARARSVLAVYVVQAAALGCVAGVLGCAAGLGVQLLIPLALASFLPFEIAFAVSWSGMWTGFGIGLTVTLLFALMPLLEVRRTSPLRALRMVVEPQRPGRMRFAVYVAMCAGLAVVAALQSGSWQASAAYAAAIGVAFGVLALLAKALALVARRLHFRQYTLRQGLANLHRPGSQTVLVMLSLGLGAFIVAVLLLSEQMLSGRLADVSAADRPDMVLFDIQDHQVEGVRAIMEDRSWSVIDSSPLVSMRIAAIGRNPVDSLMADSLSGRAPWALSREYRSTYRDTLSDAETVESGVFVGTHYPDSALVPVSLEADLAANELLVEVGDTLVMDIHGERITARVASLRRVDWEQMRSNFYMVFPSGVLESAPQTHVITAKRGPGATPMGVQTAVVESFPNVMALSLGSLIATIRSVFDKIGFAIRFMAYFCMASGLLILFGSLLISRLQRLQEHALLKTLGASRRQILHITVIEYSVLGLLASIAGLLLAVTAGWMLARWGFEVPFAIEIGPILLVAAAVTALTLLTGLMGTYRTYDQPALEVLRADG